MKTIDDAPGAARAARLLVEAADAVAASSDGQEVESAHEGWIHAYEIDGVTVVLTRGRCAERLEALLNASELATSIAVSDAYIANVRESQ